jgi:ribosomal 50S subunit-associated protein YjgA (DUF615 family)
MKEEVEKIKDEVEEIQEEHSLAWEMLHDLKQERNQLLIANIFQSVALILAIVGLLLNK